MERVENIRPEEPRRENLDALAYGNIIHQTAEMVYKRLRDDYQTANITTSVVERLIEGGYDDLLRSELRRAFNVNYVGLRLDDPEAYTRTLTGEAEIYYPEFLEIMKELLRAEPVPFEFIDAEFSKTENWALPNGIGLNFTLKIDRLDRARGKLRFVDYKTGRDEVEFNPSNVMKREKHTHREGIFQLLTYCFAYKDLIGAKNDEMQPLIYKIKNIPPAGSTFPPLMIREPRQTGVPLESYAQVSDWFEPMFCALIEEIFDPKVPFQKSDNRTGSDAPCTYCPFQTTCLS